MDECCGNTKTRFWLGGRGVREAGQGLGGGARASVPGPRDGANFATCVVFLLFLTRTKRRKWLFLKDALWGGGGTHRSWPGGKEEKWHFLKDALWGGGGTHRSWPGGRGGRPRALILAWQKGWSGRRGKGSGGGARASVPGG